MQSGNLEIDSVLNLKLKEAEVKGIEVDVEIAVPEKLGMSAYDLTVILGNILDNAIEATEKAAEPRKISSGTATTRSKPIVDGSLAPTQPFVIESQYASFTAT